MFTFTTTIIILIDINLRFLRCLLDNKTSGLVVSPMLSLALDVAVTSLLAATAQPPIIRQVAFAKPADLDLRHYADAGHPTDLQLAIGETVIDSSNDSRTVGDSI